MSDLSAVVDEYLGVWNETDPAARRARIDRVWAEDGVYVDPLAAVSGRDGFDQVVAGAQARFTGLRFVRGAVFDEHHDVVRFTWELVPSAGADPIVIGFDVAALDGEGRIGSLYGFIDRMPSA